MREYIVIAAVAFRPAFRSQTATDPGSVCLNQDHSLFAYAHIFAQNCCGSRLHRYPGV